MECKKAVSCIHEYLDGLLDRSAQATLDQHLRTCANCRRLFKQLEMMEQRIRMLKHVDTPDLTDRIMNSLPAPLKSRKAINWLKRHPALTAAVIFIVVMFSSLAALWNTDDQLVISTAEFDKIQVVGNRVIVPAGETIQGDLVVENGEVIVEGRVMGNLVVIDGTYTASTANIAGRITTVNQLFDWLWYKIAGLFGTV